MHFSLTKIENSESPKWLIYTSEDQSRVIRIIPVPLPKEGAISQLSITDLLKRGISPRNVGIRPSFQSFPNIYNIPVTPGDLNSYPSPDVSGGGSTPIPLDNPSQNYSFTPSLVLSPGGSPFFKLPPLRLPIDVIPDLVIPASRLENSLGSYFKLGFISSFPPSRAITNIPLNARSPNVVINVSASLIDCVSMEKFNNYRRKVKPKGTISEYALYTAEQEEKAAETKDTLRTAEQERKSAEAKDMRAKEIIKGFVTVTAKSSLLKLTQSILSPSPNSHALAIASSGNYGLGVSTLPGSLNNFISVGARQLVTDTDSNHSEWEQPSPPWSNAADVVTIGVNFTLSIEELTNLCKDGGTCVAADIEDAIRAGKKAPDSYMNFKYSGTSFAAPSVSAFLATRIGDNNCFNDAGPQGFKPLMGQDKDQKLVFADKWIQQSCKTKIVEPLRLPYYPK